jgi:hypothetical protein
MSFNVSIEKKQDYIRVEVSGERIRGQVDSDAITLWSNVAEVCNKNGVFHVLAVLNLTGELPTMAAYNIGTTLVQNELMKKLKIAVVDMNEKSRGTNLFLETVAVNRGGSSDRSRIFDNEKKAIEWLLGK